MRHCESIGRSAHLINLDPAADHFEYEPTKGTAAAPHSPQLAC